MELNTLYTCSLGIDLPLHCLKMDLILMFRQLSPLGSLENNENIVSNVDEIYLKQERFWSKG